MMVLTEEVLPIKFLELISDHFILITVSATFIF